MELSHVSAASAPSVASPNSALPSQPSRFDSIVAFVVRRRVAISIGLIGALLVEDLISGVVPRDILNFHDFKALAGLLLVLGGLGLRSWAAGFLTKNTQLTTTGPYALVRNPLYLGSFCLVAGFCLLINDRQDIWVLSIALPLIYGPKVLSEERWLSQNFPHEWPQYAARTRRFLPSSLALPRLAGWRLAQWLRSREYNAVLASAAGLVALVLLRNWHR